MGQLMAGATGSVFGPRPGRGWRLLAGSGQCLHAVAPWAGRASSQRGGWFPGGGSKRAAGCGGAPGISASAWLAVRLAVSRGVAAVCPPRDTTGLQHLCGAARVRVSG